MIKLSLEQQAQVLANYLPGGKTFAAKNITGSSVRKLLKGFATEMQRVDELINIFRTDILPDQTEFFIDEWEAAVGIPDLCFKMVSELDDVTRRLNITIKLACMNLQTAEDFIQLAAKFEVNITVESGSVRGAFPFTFPIIFFDDARAAHHTIIIKFTDLPAEEVFPLEFPISFGSSDQVLLQCLFEKSKPANVQIIYENL